MTFPQQPQQPQHPQYPQGPAAIWPISAIAVPAAAHACSIRSSSAPNRNPFFEWLQRTRRDFSRIGASLCLMVIIWYAGVSLLKGVVHAVVGGWQG